MRSFRIVEDNSHLILQRRDNGGDWVPQYRSPCNPTHSPITNRCATSTRPLPNPTSPKPLSAPSQPRTAASPDRPAPNHHLRPTTLEDPLADRDSFDHILRDQFGIVMKNRVRVDFNHRLHG